MTSFSKKPDGASTIDIFQKDSQVTGKIQGFSHLLLSVAGGRCIFIAMGEIFNLPVPYKDKEWLFRARLLQLGYTHKFGVRVGETDVFFEPDEEEAYRALVVPDKEPENLDLALLKAVTEAIKDVLK